MISTSFKIGLVVCFVSIGVAMIIVLRLDNTRLRQRISERQRQNQHVARLQGDNGRMQTLLARYRSDEADGTRAIDAELVRARREVLHLENRAAARRTQMLTQNAADAQSLATNRDPERGLVRLENFQNVGRATPAGAFQTFVWATMKGEDELLASMLAIEGGVREKAAQIVAALPSGDRAIYPTPEKLTALFFADLFTTMTSAQVLDVTPQGSSDATVRVRGLAAQEQGFQMQLGPNGWQLVISEAMVRRLEGWSRNTSRPRPLEK